MHSKEKQPVDWRKLKLRNGNREIKERHVAELKQSIKAHGYWPGYPIVHNSLMEIIAGQHRWKACMELEAEGSPQNPSILLCDNIDVQTLIAIERVGGVWNLMDIICAHAKSGHRGAQLLKEMCDTFHASPRILGTALGRCLRYNNIDRINLSDEECARGAEFLLELTMFTLVANSSDIYRRSGLAGAYMRLRKIPGFSARRMRDRLEVYGREKFINCTSARAQLINLLDIYNFDTINKYRLARPSEE